MLSSEREAGRECNRQIGIRSRPLRTVPADPSGSVGGSQRVQSGHWIDIAIDWTINENVKLQLPLNALFANTATITREHHLPSK